MAKVTAAAAALGELAEHAATDMPASIISVHAPTPLEPARTDLPTDTDPQPLVQRRRRVRVQMREDALTAGVSDTPREPQPAADKAGSRATTDPVPAAAPEEVPATGAAGAP